MTSTRNPIPLYALYGEETPVEETDFVHIEDIESRSSLYDWEIEAHAHGNLLQLVFIREGKANVRIDDQNHQTDDACIISIPAGIVHGFRFTPGTKGAVITVPSDFLNIRPTPADAQTLHDVMHTPAMINLSTDQSYLSRIQEIISAIFDEYHWPNTGRTMMFDALIRMLLLQIRRKMSVPHERDTKKNYRRATFMQFRNLVDDHYRDKWKVTDYAGHLGLSETRLNRICQTFTGKSAFEVLQDRILLEAQRFLIYTKAPVAEIAYDLGFNDPGYFCRFFKKLSGQTPKHFRNDKSV